MAGSTGAWTTIATVESPQLGVIPFVDAGVGPGTGQRTYADRIGNTTTLYEYQVYAINVVGDAWDYSDPALNVIPSGGGWPTLMLDSMGGASSTVVAPSGLTGTAVRRHVRSATVTLNWADNSANESGFLVQRADNVLFSVGVTNSTLSPNLTTLSQTVARNRTYYFRVLAFSNTNQSGWSNTVSVTTP